MSLNFSLTSFLFLLTIFLPKPVTHGKVFNALIVWNTGYSQFVSHIHPQGCEHIDPGGSLKPPTRFIYAYCSQTQNTWSKLHNDRFHTNYISNFRKLNLKEDKPQLILKTHNTFEKFKVLSFGHLDKESLEDLFFRKRYDGIYKSDFLILPNHGQNKYLSKDIVSSLAGFKMLITGSQSRHYKAHSKTVQKFLNQNHPLILKSQWGHLVIGIKEEIP